MPLFTLPLRLPYAGASTVEDATGETVAECPDNETAAALMMIVNGAKSAAITDRPAMMERKTLEVLFNRIEETGK